MIPLEETVTLGNYSVIRLLTLYSKSNSILEDKGLVFISTMYICKGNFYIRQHYTSEVARCWLALHAISAPTSHMVPRTCRWPQTKQQSKMLLWLFSYQNHRGSESQEVFFLWYYFPLYWKNYHLKMQWMAWTFFTHLIIICQIPSASIKHTIESST